MSQPPGEDTQPLPAVPVGQTPRLDPPTEIVTESSPSRRTWWTQGAVDWPGLVVFILACGIAISLVTAMGAIAVRSDHDVSAGQATLLSTIFGAAIGAVATYIGTTRQNTAQGRRSDVIGASRVGDAPPPLTTRTVERHITATERRVDPDARS